MIINAHKVKKNLLKRLNFSLAHELGHIILGHYIHHDRFTYEVEREADEFAGQLLMPESEISFMQRDYKLISSYFYVSELAISKRFEMINKYKQVKSSQYNQPCVQFY